MAMYEKLGYCPNNAIHQHTMANDLEKAVIAKLGDLPGYMVYDKVDNDQFSNSVSIVDMLFGENSILGFELASYLDAIIPNCRYSECGRMIVLHDVINSKAIDNKDRLCHTAGKWMWSREGEKLDPRITKLQAGDCAKRILYNENFLVIVAHATNNDKAPVHVYLLRLKSK